MVHHNKLLIVGVRLEFHQPCSHCAMLPGHLLLVQMTLYMMIENGEVGQYRFVLQVHSRVLGEDFPYLLSQNTPALAVHL